MREIKFRALVEKSGKSHPAVGGFEQYNQIIKVESITFNDDGVDLVVDENGDEYSYHDETLLAVMQYTGLEDIKGKEVAVGDVVNIHIFTLGVDPDSLGAFEDEHEFKNVEVKYGKAFGMDYEVDTFYIEDGEEISLLVDLPFHEESFEILGNIYENPELLEGD